jgi:hypothetical protein
MEQITPEVRVRYKKMFLGEIEFPLNNMLNNIAGNKFRYKIWGFISPT